MSKHSPICIVCKKPSKYLALHCEKTGIKVSFCNEHIEDCLTCGKCKIETLS